jgi:hypothetical protein
MTDKEKVLLKLLKWLKEYEIKTYGADLTIDMVRDKIEFLRNEK